MNGHGRQECVRVRVRVLHQFVVAYPRCAQLVVDQLANQRRVQRLQTAADHTVLDRLRDVARDLHRQVGLVEQFLGEVQPPAQGDLRLSGLTPQPDQFETVAEKPASADDAPTDGQAAVVEDEDAAHRERVLKEVPGEPDASVSSDSEKPAFGTSHSAANMAALSLQRE